MAGEVAGICPNLVADSADGRIESVKYQALDSMLLNELQKQKRQILELFETIRIQQERNRKLEARLEAVEALWSGKATPHAPPAARPRSGVPGALQALWASLGPSGPVAVVRAATTWSIINALKCGSARCCC